MRTMSIGFVMVLIALMGVGCCNTCSDDEAVAGPSQTYTMEQFMKTVSVGGGSFNPDETKLLVSSNSTGIFNVYVIDIATGELTAITEGDDTTFGIGYFPEDERIFFTKDQAGNELNHLYLRDLDGTVTDLTQPAGHANAYNNSGIAHWRRAVWEYRSDLNPSESLEQAEVAFKRALEINPRYAYAWTNLGMGLRTRAQAEFERGDDPSATLDEARHALGQAISINPSIAYAHNERAAVELVAVRYALSLKQPSGNSLASAASAVRTALEANPSSAGAWQTSAEVHRLKATTLRRAGASPRNEVARGLADADRALKLNPASWQAMITSAALHLLKEPTATAEACDLLGSAVQTNPLAEHDAAPLQQRCEEDQ